MWRSKKFKAAVAALLIVVAAGISGQQEWGTVIVEAVGILVAYIAAQGVADLGKEKAKIEKEK